MGQDGGVYEGVGWHRQGSHTYGYNDIGLGVAFMGNFSGELCAWGGGPWAGSPGWNVEGGWGQRQPVVPGGVCRAF